MISKGAYYHSTIGRVTCIEPYKGIVASITGCKGKSGLVAYAYISIGCCDGLSCIASNKGVITSVCICIIISGLPFK